MTTRHMHVVLGASGGAGSAILRALVDAGLPARGVGRGPRPSGLPEPAEWAAADIRTEPALAGALVHAGVVYLAAQPAYHRWPEEFPPLLATVIAQVARADARLVMVDNLYGYGPGASPMRESSPTRATDPKGRTRAAMAHSLLEAHRAGRLDVVIGRASDYFGPGAANSAITALAVAPVSGTGRLRWMGSLEAAHSCAYLPDVGRAYLVLGTAADAGGRAWHVPHAPAVTGREFLALVNAQLPQPRPIGALGPTMLRMAAPFHRVSRESLSIRYQWTEPFVVDDRDFRARFPDVVPTPLAQAVADTVAHQLAGAPR